MVWLSWMVLDLNVYPEPRWQSGEYLLQGPHSARGQCGGGQVDERAPVRQKGVVMDNECAVCAPADIELYPSRSGRSSGRKRGWRVLQSGGGCATMTDNNRAYARSMVDKGCARSACL